MKTNVWNQDYEITCKKLCLLQVFYFEVCFLAISNQPYFLRLSKVWSMLHYGSVERVQSQNNECHYIFINIIFWHFFVLFVKAWSIKFPQQNITQSEIGIDDKKLSVELHVCQFQLEQVFGFWDNGLIIYIVILIFSRETFYNCLQYHFIQTFNSFSINFKVRLSFISKINCWIFK